MPCRASAGKALAMLRQFDEIARQRYVAPVDFAYIYAALGDRDRAMEYSQRAYEDQSEMMLFLPIYGKLVGLSSDPRFQALERRVRGDRT